MTAESFKYSIHIYYISNLVQSPKQRDTSMLYSMHDLANKPLFWLTGTQNNREQL